MAYFNDYASFYPVSSASEEPNAFQFLDQTSTIEDVNSQSYDNFTDLWNMPEQPAPVVSEPTSFLDAATYGSLAAPPASSTNQTYGYGQPSHSGHYWPEAGQQTQFYHPGFFNQDYSSDSPVAPEPSVVIPTPSSVPFNYWEEIQSGPSTSKFYMENVNTYHQPSTGPIRTELMSVGGYRPYERSRTQRNEHRNAEAGPSTLAPSPIPYVGLSTLQPSGGVTSESTADAEQVQTIKEEDKVPKESKRTKCPRGKGPLRPYRVRTQGDTIKLCNWAQRQLGLREAPVCRVALKEAVRVIKTIRSPVYAESRLFTGTGKRTATNSKRANGEFKRRNVEREFYHDLSMYYRLGPGQSSWLRPPLLSRVLKDLEGIPPPPRSSDQPLP